MNIRTKKLIVSILEDPKLTTTNLAYEFNVSERSVRNDIQELNNFLIDKNLEVIKICADKHLSFNSRDLNRCFDLINKSNFYDYKLSKEERIYNIIEMLLETNDYRTISEIANRLYISTSTVNSDLKMVSQIAKKQGVLYKTEQYKGIKLEGNEFSKRLLLLQMICSNSPTSIVGANMSLHDEIRDYGIEKLNQLMSYFESSNKLMMTDDSFTKINSYLNIMMHRIRAGHVIEKLMNPVEENYRINAQNLCELVKEEFDISLPSEEVLAVANILSDLKYLKVNQVSNDIIRIQFYLNRLIDKLQKKLNIDLSTDYLFFIRLSLHVEFMCRKQIQHVVDQRILKEVCDENQNVVVAINDSLHILEELLNRRIKDIERDYIVLHVCAAIERKKIKESGLRVVLITDVGVASSQLLLEKIKSNFDFWIVDIFPAHVGNCFARDNIDLIISTVNDKRNLMDIPRVKISSSFTDDDYSQIVQFVNQIKLNKLIEKDGFREEGVLISKIVNVIKEYNLDEESEIIEKVKIIAKEQMYSKHFDPSTEVNEKKRLSELLTVDRIKVNIEASDWKDSIIKSARILLEHEYIEEEYIKAMIDKIETNGPYMVLGNQFVVPHAGVDEGGKKTGFSLVKLKYPINFNSPLGDVQYICCLSVVDMDSHLKAFLSLINLLQNEHFCNRLALCDTPESIHKCIEEYEEE